MVQNISSENLERLVTAYRNGRLDQNISPPILVIEPTNQCNINCIMCPDKSEEINGYMGFGLYTKIIDQAKDALKAILLYFRGEPLLHPNLIEMVAYAKENTDARVILSTNATLLTEEISEKLIMSKLDDIIFSIDGNSKYSYQKIKKGACYENVIENIHKFISIKNNFGGKPNIIIKLIRLGLNKTEIEPFKNKWETLGCEVEISWFNTWANQLPYHKELSDRFNPNLGNPREPCTDLWFKCVITYGGKVVLCCHEFKEQVILGDINKQSLFEIWNGGKIKLLRRMHVKGAFEKTSLCENCKEWSREEDEYIYFPEFNFKGSGGRP